MAANRGSPPIGIDLFPGAGGRPVVSLQRGASFGYDRPWTGPTLDTGWHTIYLHTVMAPDNTGSVQVWFDGQPQTFSNGAQTINYPTLASGVNWDGHTANILNVNQYRSAGAYPGTVVTYQAAAKVGTTLAAVQDSPTPPLAVPAAVAPTPAVGPSRSAPGPPPVGLHAMCGPWVGARSEPVARCTSSSAEPASSASA